MTLGLLMFVYWLAALAAGPADYAEALVRLSGLPARLALAAWSFAFFYHLLNGIRHLVWDTAHGLEKATARRSGWGVFLGALAASVLLWIVFAARFSGGAS
jgi:succinate dehydrogenase / fumarate reductase cytochrome b subunit